MGLTCAKGAKAVQLGFEVVQNYPQIVQGQQLLGEAIWYGNKCLNASNKYLQKLSRHAVKCALSTERRLVRFGEHVKKLPKACIAKTKQLIGEEVVVTDTLGNVWRSKIGESDWVTELSGRGKQALTLLNETAGGPQLQEAVKLAMNEVQQLHVNFMKHLEVEIVGLRKIFDNKVYGFGDFTNRYLKIDYEHILGMDLYFDYKNLPKLSGFHHDYMNVIENTGIIKFANKIMDSIGACKADLILNGIIVPGKTFFPAHWSREKVINSIYEAYTNFMNSGVVPMARPDGKYLIKGFANDGMEIEMFITKNAKVTTAYPKPRI